MSRSTIKGFPTSLHGLSKSRTEFRHGNMRPCAMSEDSSVGGKRRTRVEKYSTHQSALSSIQTHFGGITPKIASTAGNGTLVWPLKSPRCGQSVTVSAEQSPKIQPSCFLPWELHAHSRDLSDPSQSQYTSIGEHQSGISLDSPAVTSSSTQTAARESDTQIQAQSLAGGPIADELLFDRTPVRNGPEDATALGLTTNGASKPPTDRILNIGRAICVLRDDLHNFLAEGLTDTTIYAQNVRLREPVHSRLTISGHAAYKAFVETFRAVVKLWYAQPTYDVLKLQQVRGEELRAMQEMGMVGSTGGDKAAWTQAGEGEVEDIYILARWILEGTPRHSIVVGAINPDAVVHATYEGLSVYKFDGEGKISEHIVVDIQPAPPLFYRALGRFANSATPAGTGAL
ncbi:hypothetical protein M427DRAFT_146966 [Gonapodya prolifera JEL478]|uniref:Uncharacterized protein n=1 Tax=Gonapodya prolifera (strain JEL478) TaxID=1344416 RepID=A0A139A7S1_GONPJ|nr:hypothetical protein M427DRAFT_146966 [Gonapodya prolifera JEL478]|eukprot:KXS12739.1 hypothetical protein M427DRAFT_146966 [Gonapodya prolifera JEL478]